MVDTKRRYTVIGSTGFIGGSLAGALKADGQHVVEVGRHDWPESGEDLGHAFFCIGPTGAAALGDPVASLEAHAGRLADIFGMYRFESLTYISSTRVYRHTDTTSENTALICDPNDANDLFNATKLAAEAVCLNVDHAGVRVVRLSNVLGKTTGTDTFLTSIADQAINAGHIRMSASRNSAKDYIDIADVVALLPRIAHSGQCRLYNLASGENRTQGMIANEVAKLTGATVSVAENAPDVIFPAIDVTRLKTEFPHETLPFEPQLAKFIEAYRATSTQPATGQGAFAT